MKKIILISTLTLIIDILTKQLVINLMIENQSIALIKDFFSITYAKNTGVAFSFLEGNVSLIIIITSIIILLILKYLVKLHCHHVILLLNFQAYYLLKHFH